MRNCLCLAVVCGLILASGAAARVQDNDNGDQKKDKDKGKKDKPKQKIQRPKEDGKQAPAPPHREYRHTYGEGKNNVFVLDGKSGTADYSFNRPRRKVDLVYRRYAAGDPRLRQPSGWVYQVKGKNKEERLWFLFGSRPIKNFKGEAVYPLSYSLNPPDKSGRQPWERILTMDGTKVKELDGKDKSGKK
jgi:hypothetical protein